MRLVPATLLVALAAIPRVSAGEDLPPVDRTGLPPRSVPEPIPARTVPDWTRSHFRVGHLPGSPAMATEFLKAGYNVVILNALGRRDAVGPTAVLHPPEKVREAEDYLRAHVEKCHKAGAKAVFYVGTVQVPVGNPAFVKAHPDWLRVRTNGKPDPTPNFANVTYQSDVRLSSRLLARPVAGLAGAKPTLERQALVDAMDTARDWSWVPAYTDPCREDRFFADWAGPAGERGFTLDPKTFAHTGTMAFHFGTRKVGDPQFRGTGRKALLLDHLAAHTPDRVTVRLSHRLPGQGPTEFTAVLPNATGEGAWRTWRMEAGQFRGGGGEPLPGWDRVERFVLDGTSPANRPPVFKRLRWAD